MRCKGIFLTLILLFIDVLSFAQCAMCKAVVENGAEQQVSSISKGMNTGILFLMAIPYAIFAVFGLILFRAYKKRKSETDQI